MRHRHEQGSAACVVIAMAATALPVASASPIPRTRGTIEDAWFATRVFAYRPAPGQFVNDPQFNDPSRALGAPRGGGTRVADLSKLVTLGGFGGTITLGFARSVRDDPRNTMGLDAIVFGNSFFLGGNPSVRFAEAGVVEISRDVNNNRLADDAWFLIPGSNIADPIHQRRDGHFLLPDDPFAHPPIVNSNSNGVEAYFGYADMSPVLLLGDLDGDNIVDDPSMTVDRFYTVADDPLAVGVTVGSGGGDAFDIAWAIDPDTNLPAGLAAFDFIRITTGADGWSGTFGEVSVELGGVAAVRSMGLVPGPAAAVWLAVGCGWMCVGTRRGRQP